MTPADQIYSVPTNIGAAKLAYALANRLTVKISEMALGDGAGVTVKPDASWTALKGPVHRAKLNSLAPAPSNPNWLIAELAIPAEVGGWTIREIGLYDDDGDLIFVGNHPEQYKPVQSQGSDEIKVVRMVILVSSLASVTLRTDPTTIMATLSAVDAKIAAHKAEADPHSKYLLRSAVAAVAGGLSWLGVATGTANALAFNLVSEEAKLSAYSAGQRFHFKASAANTGPATGKIGALQALPIKKPGADGLVDLAAGDIKPGAVYDLIYDGEVFQLAGGAGGSDLPLFWTQWWPDRESIPKGFVAADGGKHSKATYPTAAGRLDAGKMPQVDEVTWQSTPTERGKYVATAEAGFFRVPDYNGKAPGSLGALFQRGDGALSAAVAGVIQRDALQNITGESSTFPTGGTAPTSASGAFRTNGRAGVPTGIAGGGAWGTASVDFDASRVARTAAETRTLNVTGCYIIKLAGTVVGEGLLDASKLALDMANLEARLERQQGVAIVYPNGGTEAAPAKLLASNRHIVDNPFPGQRVSCQLEVLIGGVWSQMNTVGTSSSTNGAWAAQHNANQIAVCTLRHATGLSGDPVTTASGGDGQLAWAHATIGGARVIVAKLGGGY